MAGNWHGSSGKIPNPGKPFFLKLASKAARTVKRRRDVDRLSYARKVMILTGLALKINGCWEEKQLLPKLQHIGHRYREYFEGKLVETE